MKQHEPYFKKNSEISWKRDKSGTFCFMSFFTALDTPVGLTVIA